MSTQSARKRSFIFVTTPDALAHCVESLRPMPSLAFDLEFDSHRNAYGTTLCLIQIATTESCFIIDPMIGLDLSMLFDVFRDSRIQKLVHSPGEDLRVLHGLGCFPQNLFDTDVAAKLLNYEQTSLSAMLFNKLGMVLDKGQQRSNWMRRPLSDEQLQYAADDVLHLHALKAALLEEADAKGLRQMIEDEQEIWSTTSFAQDENRDFFLKAPDLYNLSPFDQHVLNGLFRYRDTLARKVNKPAFMVMDEPLVRAIADGSMPVNDLDTAKGLYGSFRNARFAEQTEKVLIELEEEASSMNLSRALPPKKPFTAEDRAARARMDRDRAGKFAPVQDALTQRLGAFASRYLLSKGRADDILRGVIRLSDLKPEYKRELIRSTASSLGIDLAEYW